MTTQYATLTFTVPNGTGGTTQTQYTVASPPGGFLQTKTAPPISINASANDVGYTFSIHSVGSILNSQTFPKLGATTFTVPTKPTNIGITFMANQRAMVTFTPPTNDGGYPITSYSVTSNPGNITRTGPSSPIIIPGLTNGVPYTFTVTATNALGSSTQSTPSPVVVPAEQTYATAMGVPYGPDALQFVNLYVPDGNIAGTIMRVHGGGWASGTEITNPTVEDPTMAAVAKAGYAVIDVNYRGKNTTGPVGTGKFPNNITDIETVLNYCLTAGAGAALSPWWQTIYDFCQNHGGLTVAGISAGGHISTMAVCNYGTSTGKWPKALHSMAGPMNIDYASIFIEPMVKTLVLNDYVSSNQVQDASPFYQYGTAASPGRWFTAVNSSLCKFYFTQNSYDSLSTNAMTLATIQNFQTYNAANTVVDIVFQGPPQGNFAGTTPISMKGTVASTAALPATGQVLGDAYMVNGIIWVYNQGTYTGDALNPASVNGFTRWFDHNYSITETAALINFGNTVFGLI